MKSLQELNFPNLISFLRIALIPVILFISITHSQGLNYLASFIFLVAVSYTHLTLPTNREV